MSALDLVVNVVEVLCWMLMSWYVFDVLQEVFMLFRQLLLEERVVNGCDVIDLEVRHCGKRSGGIDTGVGSCGERSVVLDLDVVLLLEERGVNGCDVLDLGVGLCGKHGGSVVRVVDVVVCTRCARRTARLMIIFRPKLKMLKCCTRDESRETELLVENKAGPCVVKPPDPVNKL
eukprot:1489971-Amphidinium_carterae.1